MIVGSHIGRFEVLGELGAGGMGRLYRARDPALGRVIAIKLLAERLGCGTSTVHRLVADGRLVPAVRGEGIRGAMFFDAVAVERLALELAEAAS